MIRYPSLILILLLLCTVMSIAIPASAAGIRHDNIGAVQLYNLAVDEATAGNFTQADNLTAQALSIQPNFTLALVTRASVLMNLRNMTGAKEALDKAMAIDPDDANVLATMASFKLQNGADREALTYTSKALEANPNLTEAWIIKGTAHGSLGEYEEELKASEQALAISPENKLAQSNKAYATGMLNYSKKSPVSPIVPLIALICGFVLVIGRRR
jgi:tetratricopeptide (TPR) repeat protein